MYNFFTAISTKYDWKTEISIFARVCHRAIAEGGVLRTIHHSLSVE
ncbi:MAG: hypothetical protein AAF208_02875 [Cyanobacteria bacterium P01_A01_bin.45]